MPLARIASTVQKALLSHGRLAPAVTMGSGRDAFARFFGTGSLDRNAVTERVLASVKNFEKIDPNKVSTSSNFKDLGLDSLDTVEVVMALEEDFSVEIPDDEADAIQTVEQAVDYFVNHPHAT